MTRQDGNNHMFPKSCAVNATIYCVTGINDLQTGV